MAWFGKMVLLSDGLVWKNDLAVWKFGRKQKQSKNCVSSPVSSQTPKSRKTWRPQTMTMTSARLTSNGTHQIGVRSASKFMPWAQISRPKNVAEKARACESRYKRTGTATGASCCIRWRVKSRSMRWVIGDQVWGCMCELYSNRYIVSCDPVFMALVPSKQCELVFQIVTWCSYHIVFMKHSPESISMTTANGQTQQD